MNLHITNKMKSSKRQNLLACVLAGTLMLSTTGAFAAPSFGNQSSTTHLDWDFDFVETFDNLEWDPDLTVKGNVSDVDFPGKHPVITSDGTPSAWGYYSHWSSNTNPTEWIGEYGDNRVWRGSKSLTMDLSTGMGPSRFGLYMGEGYSEMHLFFMVNIDKSQWPTSCTGASCTAGGTGVYTEGEDYSYWAAWKFLTFQSGCTSAGCYSNNYGYSDVWHMIGGLMQYNYRNDPGVTFMMTDADHQADDWLRLADDYSTKNLDSHVGKWMGIEFRISIDEKNIIVDAWVYDEQGNATILGENYRLTTPGDVVSAGGTINQFFFGGNNSGSYKWGPTMKAPYNIDDVIIDDKRIGPKYFSLIKGQVISPPQPPSDFKATIQ